MTHEVFFFPNGITAVCDVTTGEQVPELQQPWLRIFMDFLQARGIDPIECILNLPNQQKATIFKTNEGYNWRIE